jgi:hypothetical protein
MQSQAVWQQRYITRFGRVDAVPLDGDYQTLYRKQSTRDTFVTLLMCSGSGGIGNQMRYNVARWTLLGACRYGRKVILKGKQVVDVQRFWQSRAFEFRLLVSRMTISIV